VPGAHELAFSDWAGPQINVRVQVPQDFDAYTPIVLVMHGASRDMPRYFDDWSAQANTHGFIAVVPEFTTTDFKGSARYNLGHVFDRDTGERRDEITWTFSAIEPLFDQVVEWAGSKQQSYALFGHSAGSQFVHRFLYYKPDARVSKAILANAGWYTMPDFGVDYPYGLSNSGVGADVLAGYFGRDVTGRFLQPRLHILEQRNNLLTPAAIGAQVIGSGGNRARSQEYFPGFFETLLFDQ
jgi:pimeloyl-ACP methyl ester carboxylesterase